MNNEIKTKQVTYKNLSGNLEILDVVVKVIKCGDIVYASQKNIQKIKHAKKASTAIYLYRNDGSIFSFKRKFQLLNVEQIGSLFNELLKESNLQAIQQGE